MPECPFCGCDPFHYVDNGVGMEAVAVVCCELGRLVFDRPKVEPQEVTLSGEDFKNIVNKLFERQFYLKALNEIYELEPGTQEWVDQTITHKQAMGILEKVFPLVRNALGTEPLFDEYGNFSGAGRTINCCYPDCGCDGARNCTAKNGASHAALELNLEKRVPAR